jgi:hypothetical protein
VGREVQNLAAVADPVLVERERRSFPGTDVHGLLKPSPVPSPCATNCLRFNHGSATPGARHGQSGLGPSGKRAADAVHFDVSLNQWQVMQKTLRAVDFHQYVAIEIGPHLDWGFQSGGKGCWLGERNTNEPLQMRTPLLARLGGGGLS